MNMPVNPFLEVEFDVPDVVSILILSGHGWHQGYSQPNPIRFDKCYRQSIALRLKMTKDLDRYTYRLTWSEQDTEHVGLCAEFPGLSWLDSSPEKALSGIRKLVKATLADMAKSGESPPEPLSLRHYSGKFMVRVPPAIHRMLALQAAESGVSLNRLVSSKLS
jgi:predicted HicB family RNase H-like nuclease